MYPAVYEGVHVCTLPYTRGTCMYPDVYEGVHVCTPSYTRGYMHVRTAGYTCVPTRSTYGEVDPFCISELRKGLGMEGLMSHFKGY